MSFNGKKIILGVTGSIAAYKAPELVRQLIKSGAAVKVVMTPSARDFVSPLALATVSKNPVHSDIASGESWNNHVALGLWADAMIVAPCSANTLGKLANGGCDNLVSAVYLSARCPVFLAPAMDEDMWLHPSTQHNLEKVQSYGNRIIPVGTGELASGLFGPGRMEEPAGIVKLVSGFFDRRQPLTGIKALVTAGPTYELLDPVRFIGNFSTGKMGVALADALASQGAEVDLVLGPSSERPSQPNVRLTPVQSAQQMLEACLRIFPECSIAVMSAAVADYRPATTAAEKIKKKEGSMILELEKNPDILATLGRIKTEQQFLAGFALETANELEHGFAKLENKNADLIVLNSLRNAGAGFGHDTNQVTLLTAGRKALELPLASKAEIARSIVNFIVEKHVAHQLI